MNNSLTDIQTIFLVSPSPELVTSEIYWLNGLIGFVCLFLSLSTFFLIFWLNGNSFQSIMKTWMEKAISEARRVSLRKQKVRISWFSKSEPIQ